MLLAVGNPVVDYMSLDIEGTEYDVSLYKIVLCVHVFIFYKYRHFRDDL